MLYLFTRGHTSQHQDRAQATGDSSNDIGIHAITNEHSIG